MAGITVKSFIVARLLELARERLGQDEFVRLQRELDLDYNSLKHSFLSNQSVEVQVRLEERLAPLIWNRTDDHAYYLFGRHNF